MNPVRQFKVDSHWDAMNQTAKVKSPEEGFGQLFDMARSEMDQPKRVQHADRKSAQQERLDRLERDDNALDRDLTDRTSRRVDNSEDNLLNKTDEIRDRLPSDMDPEDSVEVVVQDPKADSATTGEAEAVANAAIADKVIQINTAADVTTKNQQVEMPAVNNGLTVRVQKSEVAELIGQQNQGKGQEKGLSGETVDGAKQLFADEDGDEATKVSKQGATGTKEVSAAQATDPLSNKDINNQRMNHLDVLNKTTQDQSTIIGEQELNALAKGEKQKAQAMEAKNVVIEGFETVKNDQAFTGQSFGGRNSQEQGSLEHSLSNQGKGEADVKIGQVSRGGNTAVLNAGEGTNPVDMQENVDRVIKAARASINNGSVRIQIRLDPPELGYLRVELKQGSNGLHLLIQATNVKAQQLLQQNSGDLQAALESHGIQTKQIDIQLRMDLSNDQTPGQTQEDFQQQPGSQQTDTQDQSNGDGFGQGGSEPSPGQDENDVIAVGREEASESTLWQELEFSRLDVHA